MNNTYLLKRLFYFFICSIFFSTLSLKAQVFTQTFVNTGAMQVFTVPPCVNTITMEAWGAQGGANWTSNTNFGGYAKGTFTVVSGATLAIFVGAQPSGTLGGFNGGGNGESLGQGGGGASDVRVGGNALTNRILVAGGGGGAGYWSGYHVVGGVGGGSIGGDGYRLEGTVQQPGGQGGTQTGSGLGTCITLSNPSAAGGLGYGGVPSGCGCEGYGGGGGYYGGAGSGNCRGGGGGSGFILPSATNTLFTSGITVGHGKIIFSYSTNGGGVLAGVSSSSICSGTSISLTASNVVTYTWNPGNINTASFTAAPTTNTSYTVQGTNNLGCISSAVFNVTVDPGVPSLTITNTANSGGICPTKTVMLTASGASGYTWTGGSPTVTNGVAFSPTVPGTYIVTGTNACGSSTAAASVSVHPLPNVTGTASSPSLCAGSSLTLTGVGNATAYAWSGASGITNGVGFVPSSSTNYTVVGTSALSCTAAATVSVPVFASPNIPPIAQPALICIGNSSTLTATGATGYTWTGGSSTGNNSTYVVTPSAPGISTYTVLRANSTCTTSQQISVVTNSLPTAFAIVSGPTLVCASTAVTLAVAGGQTYTWTSPGNPPIVPSFSFTGANPVVFPPVNTIYTVAAHDGTCINTTTVAVGTNPNPTLITTASPSMICQGEIVTVSVTGGSSYTWTSTSPIPSSSVSFTDMPLIATAYNVTGDNSFGCTSSAQQIVLVNTSPTLAVGVVANKTLVCNGGTSSITVSGADSYTWSSGNPIGSGTMVIVTSTNSSSGPVIYTVSGTSTLTQCSISKTISVNVFAPALTVSGTTIACIGGPIALNASGGNNGWSWQTPGNPPSNGFSTLNTTISAAAVFTVSANTNSLSISCPASATIGVDVYPTPSITAVAQRTTICVKESVVLTAGGGTAYVWSNNLAQTTTISVSPATNTNYTVTGTDLNGCSNTGTVNVKVLGCTGIGELSASNGLNIYPNPNSGEFFVQSNSDAKLILVNELGQIVRTLILSGSNNYKVQISEIAQGIYFLKGEKEGTLINQKIVITK